MNTSSKVCRGTRKMMMWSRSSGLRYGDLSVVIGVCSDQTAGTFLRSHSLRGQAQEVFQGF